MFSLYKRYIYRDKLVSKTTETWSILPTACASDINAVSTILQMAFTVKNWIPT